MQPIRGNWQHIQAHPRRQFTCGHCGRETGTAEGYVLTNATVRPVPMVYICGSCNRPVFFESFGNDSGERQTPAPPMGRPVEHLPPLVDALWREARDAARAGAYSAAGMVARSLIMHVAVEKTAPSGERQHTFAFYVSWLATEHHVPVGARGWVDRIRVLGNEAAHEIVVLSREQAEEALTFTEALLRMTYELPGKLPAP